MADSTHQTSKIIDIVHYNSLINENRALRKKLLKVSSVGIVAMFHTHRSDCCHFRRDVLKGVVNIMQEIEVQKIQDMYQDGYDLACQPSVLEQFTSN